MTTAIILLFGLTTAIVGLTFKVQNGRLNRIVTLFHLAFLFLTIVCIILLTQNLSFKGFYTDRIIISIWFATGIALYGLYRKGSINLISRIYYGFLFWTPIFFLIAWFIPRLHFMAAVFGLGLIIDGQANRFSINEKFQLQESFQGVLASSYPSLDLVKNLGIFEKTTKGYIYRPSSTIKKINFTLLPNDSLKVTIITREDINTEYSDTTVRLPE
jgi:hypothetical protein